jgi:FkbH-like protein
LKLAISATFTAEPIAAPLEFWLSRLALSARVEFASYNQVFQELLDPDSLIGRNRDGINVILVRFEDWCRSTGAEPGAKGLSRDGQHQIERNVEDLLQALKSSTVRSSASHLLCLLPASPRLQNDPVTAGFLRQKEERLTAALSGHTGIHVVTSRELAAKYPVPDYFDVCGEESGHIPYTPLFFAALATMVARRIYALRRSSHKVIVLDCDNTLWKGVCGEDGALGIEIDAGRYALQEFVVRQQEAGMLLCLCSKNQEADVFEVFDRHPDMPLKRQHLVAWRINWQSKSENLKALAGELNLGLDSFIFVDDNAVECAEVAANSPDVLALQLPAEEKDIPRFLDHVWAFDHLKVTEEDRRRTALYQQNLQRERFEREATTLEGFLAGLNLQIEIVPASENQIARISQLTERTNQFNFTTIRRSENEIRQLWQDGRHKILTVSVRDRFGDYGLVGVMIFELPRRTES